MRIRVLLLTGLLAGGVMSAASAAQGVSLASGFTDFTTWTRFGSASAQNDTPGNGFTYSNLNLTAPNVGGQAGAGFAPGPITLDFNQAFVFDFHFFIPVSQGLRGDGLTFTLAGTPAVGTGGSGLGYEGLGTDSIAFAVDTFHFSGDPVSPSLQILKSGNVTPLAFTETGLGDTLRDPNFQWRATVSYAPSGLGDNSGLLSGEILHANLGTFTVSAAVDFNAVGMVGNPVYYGFTASNGLATDGHFVTSAVPVPEPGTALLWLAGLGLMVQVARRRRPV